MSLGAGEKTLLKLTNAYAMLVNGGKLIEPTLIDRIQNRHGKTIFKHDLRDCGKCRSAVWQQQPVPVISDHREQVVDPATAYQMVSMLEGVVQRGTGRRMRSLGRPLAGKTGTTNKALDTWFVGFTSKLVVGVYVGLDEPKSLGRYETGAKTALPIFKDFVKKAIKKKDAKPFKVAPNIIMIVVEPFTGKKASFGSKETIIEVFKKEKMNNEINSFGNIKDRLRKDNILKFY